MKSSFAVLVVTCIVSGSGHAADLPVVGTWQVKSYSSQNVATNEVAYPFGRNVTGYIQYSPGGHMVVFLQTANPAKPKGSPLTEADRAAAHRTIFGAYAGTYTVEGNKVMHHVIASWRPENVGVTLTRFFELKGKQLTLTTAPGKSSWAADDQVATLVFEKLE